MSLLSSCCLPSSNSYGGVEQNEHMSLLSSCCLPSSNSYGGIEQNEHMALLVLVYSRPRLGQFFFIRLPLQLACSVSRLLIFRFFGNLCSTQNRYFMQLVGHLYCR